MSRRERNLRREMRSMSPNNILGQRLRDRVTMPPGEGETVLQRQRRRDGQHISWKWEHHEKNPVPLPRLLPGGPPRFEPQGIRNPGILCYRNSLIQSLFHTPKVANWLKFNHAAAGCQAGPNCVACAIRDLLDEYWTHNAAQRQRQRNNSAGRLQDIFGRACGFVGRKRKRDPQDPLGDFTQSDNQEDSEELYLYIYGRFSMQLPRAVNDVINSIFQADMLLETKCQQRRCRYLTQNHDPRSNMKLMFPDNPASQYTLGELIRYHYDPFHNRRQGYRCEQCNTVYDPPVHMRIEVAPDVLVIHIARFAYTAVGRESKVSSRVRFGKLLDLSKYLITPGFPAKPEKETLQYELVASLQHRGTLHEGHYFTAAKDPAGTWHEVEDDVRPRKVTWDAVQKGRSGFLPYMLFYRRIVHRVAASGRVYD